MIRPLTLFWFLLAATSVGMVFVISHEVTLRERQLDKLRVEVQKTQDRIHVLRAEWAYLGRPQNLEHLAAQHLGLAPIPPERIIELADLPRPEDRPKEEPLALAKAGKPKPHAAPAATQPATGIATASTRKPAEPAAPLGNRVAPPAAVTLPTVPAASGVASAIAPAAARSLGGAR